MLSPSQFRELVSGRQRGVSAALLRAVFRTLEIPYSAAVRLRNRRYDSGRAESHRVNVPVISVGNITLGGTGKTPAVEWLARWFLEHGVRIGLVSRGYGSKDGKQNDEAMELADKLPAVPHVLDPDRVRGARRAIEEFGCRLILLDDGFQHRRLERDFDLVLIDALEPFGFEYVFPRGTLREPLGGWARANAFLLTRSEQLDAEAKAAVRHRAQAIAPHALWLESTYQPVSLRGTDGSEQPLETLVGKPLAAFCGIGNPAGFRRALAERGFQVQAFREFADHYAYPPEELESLAAWAKSAHCAAVICTYKDLVKVRSHWTGDVPLVALNSRLEIIAGQGELEAALAPLVERATSH